MKLLLNALWQSCRPCSTWQRLSPALARSEALAGLTVAWMIIPQGIAYALLAGMPPISGVYMCLLPAIVAAMWGSSATLAAGPSALTCVLVSVSIASIDSSATPQSTVWIQWAVWLALFSGVMQWVLGAFRLGWFINLVSSPVMMGFSQAAACLIIASQLPSLLGLTKLPAPINILNTFTDNTIWHVINPWAASFGIAALILLFTSKYGSKKIPWVLVVIMLAASVSAAYDYGLHAAVVGALPLTMPTVSLPTLPNWVQAQALCLPVLIISLVSFLETASSAKIEHQHFGTRWNDNRDLIAQGLAKISSSLVGAAPSSASFSRSALNLYAGARTQWSVIFMVIFTLILLLIGQKVLVFAPRAVLAAVVITAVSGLIRPSQMLALWRSNRDEAIISILTFIATLTTAPALYWGVLLGVILSLGHFLYQRLHPRIIEVGLHADGSLRDRILWSLPPLGKQVYALRMDAALDFASSTTFEQHIFDTLAARPDIQHLCVFAQPINRIDATGLQMLVSIHSTLKARGLTLHLSGLKLPLEQAFARAEVLTENEHLQRYRSESETITALRLL